MAQKVTDSLANHIIDLDLLSNRFILTTEAETVTFVKNQKNKKTAA